MTHTQSPPSHAKRTKPAARGKHYNQRLDFIIKLIELAPPELVTIAASAAGIKSKSHARQRILDHLREHRTIEDAPRERQPHVFTEAVLDQALEVLAKGDEVLTARELLVRLQERGVLDNADHDVTHFLHGLRNQATGRGWHMQPNCTSTSSFLAPNDPAARVAYCSKLLKLLQADADALKELVFLDETSILESEHPKCKRMPGRQAQFCCTHTS